MTDYEIIKYLGMALVAIWTSFILLGLGAAWLERPPHERRGKQ